MAHLKLLGGQSLQAKERVTTEMAKRIEPNQWSNSSSTVFTTQPCVPFSSVKIPENIPMLTGERELCHPSTLEVLLTFPSGGSSLEINGTGSWSRSFTTTVGGVLVLQEAVCEKLHSVRHSETSFRPWWVCLHHRNGKSAHIRTWLLFPTKPIYQDIDDIHSCLFLILWLKYLVVDPLIHINWDPDKYQPSARSWELDGKIDKIFTPMDCTCHTIHFNSTFIIAYNFAFIFMFIKKLVSRHVNCPSELLIHLEKKKSDDHELVLSTK